MDPPKPFVSDGCSILGPIANFFGYHDEKMRRCCVEHDKAYWRGGPLKLKRWADTRFWFCLQVVAGVPKWIASLMWLGVTVGGFVPHPKFRWGFGWPFPRFREPQVVPN